ncbi:MAG: alpha/beta hydrolase [Bacteroidales bacterium]|nr:alpha/beta hydrolase [Bacteroidales bacterium]
MRKFTFFALFLCFATTIFAQQVLSNRFAMRLIENEDGSFELRDRARLAALVDLDAIPDLLVPYVHQRTKISGNDYRHIRTQEFVFKTDGYYELTLAVDFAESDVPTPFMIYLHGGGWQRGTKNANRSLSRYTAAKGGITGVRISYTLSGRENSNAKHSIQDVLDALKWVQEHAEKLNVNPNLFGFYGNSAGAHLAAMAALKTPGTSVLIGTVGIYDLQTSRITIRATDPERIRYFAYLDPQFLYEISPINHISPDNLPATFLIHGTADIIVEVGQSKRLAEKLKSKGAQAVRLDIHPNYDHNITSSTSDLQEVIFLDAFQFMVDNLTK